MILFFEIIVWLQLLFSLMYLAVIVLFTLGWYRLKKEESFYNSCLQKVSVVVAVRNEEKNILQLLNGLLNQTCNHNFFEIIIVDDHSEDNTVKLINEFAVAHTGLNIKLLHSKGKGKKPAVYLGVQSASHRLIITTDGDCIPHKQWIYKISAYFAKHQPRIILGPVACWNEKGLKQQFFSLDFISLVASGAGAAGAGVPFMGNAANMAFDKNVFVDNILERDFASGDDVFLIHWVKKHFGSSSIHFIKDTQALVVTQPPDSWKTFFNQRLRWASKAKGYHDVWSMAVSWIVLLFNMGLTIFFIAGFFWSWMWAVWLLFMVLKTLIDFPLLSAYTRLAGKSKQLIYLWPLELIYPLYTTAAGIGSVFIKYSWKGRAGLK